MQSAIKKARRQAGLPETVDTQTCVSIVDMVEQAVDKYADNMAYTGLGKSLTYTELLDLSRQFAAYLQQTNLQVGDRIAVQLPNILQYPVVVYGAMMAGLVVVNTNPLYTARELQHQLRDSGAKALVVFAHSAHIAERVLPNTDVEQVIVTEIADMHACPKRWLINGLVKYVKRLVPAFSIQGSVSWADAMRQGQQSTYRPVELTRDHIAVLQYTGGTTGIAKGAMLTHGNLVANVLQCVPLFATYGLESGTEVLLLPLPFYHIYSFTISMLLLIDGNGSVFIPDPRNIDSLVNDLQKHPVSVFCGINPLFVALCHHPVFKTMDFSGLKLTLSGGMALTLDAVRQWQDITGNTIVQGYGLTETSPVVAGCPGTNNRLGTIGVPISSTEVKIIDRDNNELPVGEAGELCIKGPQVMKGYWQNPEATAEVIDGDGWFHSGDVAQIDEEGHLTIVDRIKDMIIVSGFNVYPNEVEAVVSNHPDVMECVVVGVPDESSGEAVKLFVVPEKKGLTEETLIQYCRQSLAAYKVPHQIEFRDSLPKSVVGKVLRRELRE